MELAQIIFNDSISNQSKMDDVQSWFFVQDKEHPLLKEGKFIDAISLYSDSEASAWASIETIKDVIVKVNTEQREYARKHKYIGVRWIDSMEFETIPHWFKGEGYYDMIASTPKLFWKEMNLEINH